ncbi:MAG TPA: acetate--CoA ligase family protein [Casimicrobiaceae bacterium]|nr:acetate--CoA ligase family protein [Casimicrobiaceae bacterium]
MVRGRTRYEARRRRREGRRRTRILTSPRFADIRPILEPRSIAVVGASDQPGNLGGETVRHLVRFGYPGRVWPVSRTAATVAGLPSFPRIASLPEVPELAILAIPAHGLLGAIEECATFGVRHGIAYAGGLADAGGEGAQLQQALVALCREREFALCGPNCVGVINATTPAPSTFSTALLEIDALKPGGISMVCQSGGIATTAFSMVLQAGFGFRHLVSSGNEAVVDFADYLHAFAQDPGTRIIGGYLEGIADGPKFVRSLEAARKQGKPVVLIKAGTTGATARAAQAHTGALVGDDRVVDAVLGEMGVLRVRSVEELVDVVLLLVDNQRRLPTGSGVGVITFGGGNGVLGADQCAQNGLATPPLSAACAQRLRPLLVPVATAANPLDLTPTTAFRPEAMANLPQALDVFAAEPPIQSLLFVVGSMAAKASEICDVVGGLAERTHKPLCVSWPSPPRAVPGRLAERGIYAFPDPARGIRAVARWVEHGLAVGRPSPERNLNVAPFEWQAFVPIDDQPAIVSEPTCHRILTAAGLAVAAGELVGDEAGASRAADALGLPVVLKGITPRITHRANAGLIAIDLRSEDEVCAAYRRLHARAVQLGVALDGVLVQKLEPRGTELIVTAFRDAAFGVMVGCGSGGGLTELVADLVVERAPVGHELAAHMLARLRTRAHATDAQGDLPFEPAAWFVSRFSELALTAPWHRFVFEVNPVAWRRDRAVALDGLLVIGG